MIRQSYGMTYIGCGELGFSTSDCCTACKTVEDWPFIEVLHANPPIAPEDPNYYPLGIGGIVCCHHLHAARSISRDVWIQIAKRYGARIGSTRADLARVSGSSTRPTKSRSSTRSIQKNTEPSLPSLSKGRSCIFCGKLTRGGSICESCRG